MATSTTPSKSPGQRRLKIMKRIALGFMAVFVALFIWGTYVATQQENKENAAAEAEKARLAADPVTTSGIYTAINKERAASGAPAMASLTNLTTASEQMCADMVTHKYLDYKNPITGKEANSFIEDNVGDLYYETYVASVFTAIKGTQSATDAAKAAVNAQATTLNDPTFNSVGWSTCQFPDKPEEILIVGMLADKQEKPVAPTPARTSSPTYQYRSPTTCHTTYNDYGGYLSPTATTRCY